MASVSLDDDTLRRMAQAYAEAARTNGGTKADAGTGTSGIEFMGKDFKRMAAEGQKWIDNQKKINAEQKTLKDTLTGNKKAFKDFSGELEAKRKAIKDATAEERKASIERNKAAARGDTVAAAAAETRRKEIAQSKQLLAGQEKEIKGLAAKDAVSTTFQNLSATAVNLGDSLVKAGISAVQGLQAGKSGTEIGGDLAVTAAKATGETLGSVGDTASAFGSVMEFGSKKLRIFGKALELGGMALSIFGKKSAEYAGEAAKTLNTEIANTKESYKTLTQSGAVLAGGMTEMRQEAAKAGLDVKQFSSIVSKSKDDLVFLGLGLGEASKRLGGVSKELRNSDLGIQLRKLGYSAEEQTELAASLMANQKAAGITRVMSDNEIAKATAAYGKDLKVLADLTGQDAKKAMEKARMESMRGALMNKLDEKQQAAFLKSSVVMGKLGPEYQEALMQKLAGLPITNPAIAASQELQDMVATAAEETKKGNADIINVTSNAITNASKQMKAQGESGLAAQTDLVNLASRGSATTAANIGNAMGKVLTYTAETDAAKKIKENADAAASNVAPLDTSIAGVDEAAQKLRASLGENLTGPITKFASTMSAGAETLEAAFKRLGLELKPESTSEKVGGTTGAIAGAVGGASLGATIGGVAGAGVAGLLGLASGGLGLAAAPWLVSGGAALGGWIGGDVGMDAGEAGGKMVGKGVNGLLQASGGGIFEGPTDGFPVMLHGTEAVVPLDNSASKQELPQIAPPPPIDLTGMISAMESLISTAREQLDKQDEMLRAMNDTKDATERLYHVMS